MNHNRDTLFNITERLDAKSVNTLRMVSKQLQNEVTAVAPESLRTILKTDAKVSKSGDSYEFGHDIWNVSVRYDQNSKTISGFNLNHRVIGEAILNYDKESYEVTVLTPGGIDFERLGWKGKLNIWIYGLLKTALEWIENSIYKFKNTEYILDQIRSKLRLSASDVKDVESYRDMLLLLSKAKRTIYAQRPVTFRDSEDDKAPYTHEVKWKLPQIWHISMSGKGLMVQFESANGIKKLNISAEKQTSDFTNKQTELIFNTIMNRMQEFVKNDNKSSKTTELIFNTIMNRMQEFVKKENKSSKTTELMFRTIMNRMKEFVKKENKSSKTRVTKTTEK